MKISGRQGGVPTFFDNLVLAGIGLLRRGEASGPGSPGKDDPFPHIGDKTALFRRFLQFRQHERFNATCSPDSIFVRI